MLRGEIMTFSDPVEFAITLLKISRANVFSDATSET
jgi:hypothetical protein